MEIPNGEVLYRYAHPSAFPPGQEEIPSSIFNDTNLSCDWQKYREDPRTSPHIRAGRSLVIYINVCDEIKNPRNQRGVVDAWKQEVLHDPVTSDASGGPNDAHSLIRGPKKSAVVSALRKHSSY